MINLTDQQLNEHERLKLVTTNHAQDQNQGEFVEYDGMVNSYIYDRFQLLYFFVYPPPYGRVFDFCSDVV